ncbi:MAG: magnesium transporter [Gemmatimonadaceae bacterium]
MSPQRPSESRPLAALLLPDILEMLKDAPESIAPQTEEMHPADLADVAETLPEELVRAFLRALPKTRAAEVLEYLDDDLRTQFLEEITAGEAATIVAEMTPDERADALDELDEETADEILSALGPAAQAETERLLQYDSYTAGGLMTTEFVSVDERLTVEEALRVVRTMARAGRREAMYTIYTTEANGRLRGVMSLRELLAAPEGVRIAEVAWSEVVSVPPEMPQEEVSQIISNYDVVSLPVVDASRNLLGVVTVDDIIDVIQEEQTEDAQKFGGMEAIEFPYMQTSLPEMIRKRAGWLAVLFVSELFTSSAMQHYNDALTKVGALIMFIPLIMSSGGNSGSQATSLILRALALREIELRDWWRVAMRELPSGLALGGMLGIIGVARVSLWQYWFNNHWHIGGFNIGSFHVGQFQLGYDYKHPHEIALTVGFALLGIVTFGSLAGSMLPFLLRRLGFDPASASAPFVATLVDVTGLVIYFSVAAAILGTLMS